MKKVFVTLSLLVSLFANEELGFTLFEKSKAVMLIIDPNEGNILAANRAAEEFYGVSESQLKSKKISDINTFTKEQIEQEMDSAKKEDRNFFIFRHKTETRGVVRVEVYSNPITYEGKDALFSIINTTENRDLNAAKHYSYNLEKQVDITTEELLEKEKLLNKFIIGAVLIQSFIIALLLVNIRKRKAVEKELNATLETLEDKIKNAVEKTKSQDRVIYEQRKSIAMNELLLNLSHQWRQPLNVISLHAGFIEEVVEDDCDKESIKNSVTKIVEESKELSDSISLLKTAYNQDDDLLSNVESSFLKVEKLIEKHFLSLGIEIEKDIDSTIYVQIKESDLVEIFIALMYNVYDIVKNRQLGSAKVVVKVYGHEDKTVISVSDNCGGFDDSLLPDGMFEPYTTTNFKARNKGLGLYILKNIVVNHLRGKVFAENKPQGAQITILVERR